jgi:hypothetical protein
LKYGWDYSDQQCGGFTCLIVGDCTSACANLTPGMAESVGSKGIKKTGRRRE